MHHPVLDDPELTTWQAYTARAWPTLVLVDPEGYVVATYAGEGHAHAISALLAPVRLDHDLAYDVVVADTVGHRLAGLSLATDSITTLAGDGRQWFEGDGASRLSSPWDVVWWQDRIWIAMAGIHQLWTFDPVTGTVEVAAGTGNEGLLDGPLADAWFAQSSGLAVDGDRALDRRPGDLLAALDRGRRGPHRGRHRALRLRLPRRPGGPRRPPTAPHPLGVAVQPDRSVVVADTYNGAVRRFVDGALSTIASGLAEPSGL